MKMNRTEKIRFGIFAKPIEMSDGRCRRYLSWRIRFCGEILTWFEWVLRNLDDTMTGSSSNLLYCCCWGRESKLDWQPSTFLPTDRRTYLHLSLFIKQAFFRSLFLPFSLSNFFVLSLALTRSLISIHLPTHTHNSLVQSYYISLPSQPASIIDIFSFIIVLKRASLVATRRRF